MTQRFNPFTRTFDIVSTTGPMGPTGAQGDTGPTGPTGAAAPLGQSDLFIGFDTTQGTAANTGDHRGTIVAANSRIRASWAMPADFGSIVFLEVLVINSANLTGTKSMFLRSDYGVVGELFNFNSESNVAFTKDFTNSDNEFLALDVSSVFSSVVAGDICGLRIKHNLIGGDLFYLGVRLRYNKL